jgi:hypothetical protein
LGRFISFIEPFFTQKEYFTWIEAGYKTTSQEYTDGNSVHLTYWCQDARAGNGYSIIDP